MFVEHKVGDQVSYRQPQHAVNLVKSLSKSRKEGTLCDVTLVVGGKEYVAHKMILASSSDYFRVMFTGHMEEAYKDKIAIESISCEIFDQLMDYFYEGTFSMDMFTVADMLHASNLLLLKDIETECFTYLRQNISLQNCVQVKYIGDSYSNKELINRCSEFIKRNFENLCKEKEITNLSFSDFKSLLLSDDIKCKSEDIVADVINKWLAVRTVQEGNVIRSLVKAVRFPYLSKVGVEQLTSAMTALDKKFDSTEYSTILLSESKLQHRHSKKQMVNCRTAQRVEKIVFCLAPDGNTYAYHIGSKKLRYTAKYPLFRIPGVIVTDSSRNIVYGVGGNEERYSLLYDNFCNKLYSYNPNENTWLNLPDMNHGRTKHCAVVFQGKLYVIGGKSRSDVDISDTVEVYCPETKTWSNKPNLNNGRIGSAIAASDRFIYVMGGESMGGGIRGIDTVEKYCPKKDKWLQLPSLNHLRIGSSAVYFNSKVYVFGGSNGVFELQSFEYMESSEKKWTTVTIPYSSPVSIALVFDEKILAMGGTTWGDDLCLQYSFVRRRGVNWKVLRDFIHPGHRIKNFKYTIIKMLNYDLENKLEGQCDCKYVDDEDEDDSLDRYSDMTSESDIWFDHDPFDIFI